MSVATQEDIKRLEALIQSLQDEVAYLRSLLTPSLVVYDPTRMPLSVPNIDMPLPPWPWISTCQGPPLPDTLVTLIGGPDSLVGPVTP